MFIARKQREAPLQLTEAKDQLSHIIPAPKIQPYAHHLDNSEESYFTRAEFDLEAVHKISKNETLVSISIQKTTERILNTGWSIYSKSPRTSAYVKRRMSEIEENMGMPFPVFFEQLISQIVTFNNAFVYIDRTKTFSSGKPVPIRDLRREILPIATLENLNTISMKPKLGKYSKRPIKWELVRPASQEQQKSVMTKLFKSIFLRHETATQKNRTIMDKDILHFFINQEPGYIFGTPWQISVIPDIIELRRVEEYTNDLARKAGDPLIHLAIGSEDSGPRLDADGREIEVEQYTQKLADQSPEGFLITSNRVKVERVTDPYNPKALYEILGYWKGRVKEGCYLSSISLGDNSGTSRSSAYELTQEGVSRAKYYSILVSAFMTYYLVNSLLKEGGIDPSNEEDTCVFKINEVDTDMMIRLQTHALSLFNSNAVTHEEMRAALGFDGIGDGEEERLFFKMISEHLNTQKEEAKQKITGANQYGSNTGKSRKDSLVPEELELPGIGKYTFLVDKYSDRKEVYLKDGHTWVTTFYY